MCPRNVDVQGSAFDGRLMTVVVLLCSSLFINVKGNITATDLDRLGCFVKVATMISGSDDTRRGAEVQNNLNSAVLTTPLPLCTWTSVEELCRFNLQHCP